MLGLLVPQQCKSVLIYAIHLHHRQRAIVVVLQQKSEWKTAEARRGDTRDCYPRSTLPGTRLSLRRHALLMVSDLPLTPLPEPTSKPPRTRTRHMSSTL